MCILLLSLHIPDVYVTYYGPYMLSQNEFRTSTPCRAKGSISRDVSTSICQWMFKITDSGKSSSVILEHGHVYQHRNVENMHYISNGNVEGLKGSRCTFIVNSLSEPFWQRIPFFLTGLPTFLRLCGYLDFS